MLAVILIFEVTRAYWNAGLNKNLSFTSELFIYFSQVHPRIRHEDPEGEQMYSSTLPSTSALDGGRWPTPPPGCFTPSKDSVPNV